MGVVGPMGAAVGAPATLGGMPCRTWLPFALLALVTLRAVDLWQAGELDPFSLAVVPIGAALVVWLVRQPGCDGAACAVPDAPTGEAMDDRAGGPTAEQPDAVPGAGAEATADVPAPDGGVRR